MIVKCPECGHQVSDHAKTCPGCGVDIKDNIKVCPECGETVLRDNTVCPACHAILDANRPLRPIYNNVENAENTAGGGEQNAPKPKKKGRTTMWIIVSALVITLSVVFAGLYMYQNMQRHNEEEAYLNAISSDEPSVLQNYLDIYGERAPQEHIDSVNVYLERFRMMDKEWNDARISRNKTALERYVKMHPGSVHEPEALLMIDSLDWVTATVMDTQESYMKYMNDHRDGLHYDEALQQHDKKAEEQRHAADTLSVADREAME